MKNWSKVTMVGLTILLIGVSLYGQDSKRSCSTFNADIHHHASIHCFTPTLYDNPTTISFSNGITFDTRSGEPILPADLKSDNYCGIAYYLIQVTGPVINNWKQEIVEVGAGIVGYIPNYTLIVRTDESGIEKIKDKSFVRWTGIFQPAYKIQKELFLAEGEARITLQIFPDEDVHTITQVIAHYGFKIESIIDHPLLKTIDVTGELSRLNEIAKIPGVHWIQLWTPVEHCNNNCQWVVQTGWCSSVPGAEGWRIWNEGIRGNGIILSTTDSGIRTDHIVYYDAGNPITGPGVYPDHRKIVAYKLYAGASFGDVGGCHGSHVNCTVAGDDSINGGNDPYDGMAKDARLYFLDIVNASGGYVIPPNLSAMYDSIYSGRDLPYNILQHSGSWGWPNSSGTYLIQDASTDAICWLYKDFLNLFAAGNTGPTEVSIWNPAIAKNVLTVGGTGNGTSSSQMYSWSSRGPTQDNRNKPNIVAPADWIMSADGNTTNEYKFASGTSMATPAANGAVGLIRHYLLGGYYPTGSANPSDSIKYQSGALLRAMAMVSADPNVGSDPVPAPSLGWGRIDVDSVLYFSGDVRKLIIVDDTIGVGTGQAITDSFQVESQIPLRVCMAWTDTAAAPNANPTLVNDLNLKLVAPDGTYYRGNQYSGGESIQNPPGWDNVNVEECCRINAPEIGVWKITISGQQIVFGPQPFAYAITGDIDAETGVEEESSNSVQFNYKFNCRLLASITRGLISLEVFLTHSSNLEVNIIDVCGRKVTHIFTGKCPAGRKIIKHKSTLPGGLYFLRIETEEHHQVRKVLIF